MIWRRPTALWLALLAAWLAGCQRAAPIAPPPPAEPVRLVAESPAHQMRWPAEGDCRHLLAVLKRGLDDGTIGGLDGTPFLLLPDPSLAAGPHHPLSGLRGSPPADDLSAGAAARCVLRVGAPAAQRSDHRVLASERVRSRFQSGTRSEKNPAYEVAKARVRQAEKAAKPGKSPIVKVGDPLIDLVGTLVGGALTGVGQWGKEDQLEQALDRLAATPPSIDHPVYRSYHFDRSRVRAEREATVPVTLTDRRLRRSWQTSLKRRESRDLVVIEGLDRQDEDYAHHRQNSLSEGGLRQWLAEAPTPSLTEIAAGLIGRPSSSPLDRLALAGTDMAPASAPPIADDLFLDAAASPAPEATGAGARSDDRAPASRPPPAGRVTLIGEAATAEGVFVAPHFILAPSEVIGERGLVDIENASGYRALGLVAAIDRGLGLALVQAPQAGEPVTVGRGAPRIRAKAARMSPGRGVAAPLLVEGRLAGFGTATGPDIERDAIESFLDRQGHLLPPDR